MKYLCLAYGDEKDWNQLPKDERDALLRQDDALRQRGDLVAAVDASAVTVSAWDGVPKATAGGFAESQVPLAGFSIIEAPDLERAIELVADTPCARAKGAVELRPIEQINDQGTRAAGILGRAPESSAEARPVLGEAHRRLAPFVGRWTVVGTTGDTAPMAPNASVTGEEDYIFLPGGFFLLGHWDRRIGDTRHIGMSVVRYDAAAGEYSAYYVDNLGFARTYRVTERDGFWSFTGDRERATIAMSEDARAMTMHWEHAPDGVTWSTLCDLEASRSA